MNKKNIVITTLIIITVILISNEIAIYTNHKSIFSIITENEKIEAPYPDEQMIKTNQVINANDTKIILTRYHYEYDYNEKIYKGYCEFEITKNDGKDKIKLPEVSVGGCFLNRFWFLFDIIDGAYGCYINYKSKDNGKKILMYLDFYVNADSYNGKLYVYDSKSGKEFDDEYSEGYFQLIENSCFNDFFE